MLTGENKAQIDAIRLGAESKLSGFKVGGPLRFRRVDIEDWINRESSPNKDKKR